MSSWLTEELRQESLRTREELGHIGMILTHNRKGQLLKWRLRYETINSTIK
jgi:hypothetical protein